MKTSKRQKKYIEILGDIVSVNRIVFVSYVVCAVVYGLLGYELFYTPRYTGPEWKPIMYYILLVLPILLASVDYAESRHGLAFRYSLYLPAVFFYAYMLMLDEDHLHFLYAICMIGMSVIYCDARFSALLGILVVGLHVATAYILSCDGDGGLGLRLFHAGLILVIVFFFNFSSGIIVTVRNTKLADVSEEKERFRALASVDGKWVFEYDIAKDKFVITKDIEDGGKEKQGFDRVSQEAKLQRHVLYADWDELDRFISMAKEGKPVFEVQLRLRNYNADYLWFQFKARTLMDEEGKPVSVIGTMENINERKRMELRIADENMRDPLTKLYERNHARKLIDEFLGQQDGTEYAGLLLVDVDDFSKLVDKMGATFAEEVLKSMATDLDEIFYTSDILGRVGGDAFVILMKNIKKIPDLEKKMQEIQDVVQKTYSEAEMKFASTVTIGASVFPLDGKNCDELYSNAEKALVYEKEQGKNRYGLYDHAKEEEYDKLHIEEMHNKIVRKHELELTYERKESDSLIELAFKLIDEAKDTDSAINLLLRQITRQMGLDAICVRQRVGREHKMTYPYRCIIGDYSLEGEEEIVHSDELWDRYIARIKETNGYIACDNVEDIEDDFLRESCKKNGIRAYVRCSYFEKEEYVGSIDFVSCSDVRKWSKEDRQTIQAVTNVISSYLLKMKAYEDASDTIERLTGFDAVTGFYKYEKFLELAQEFLKTAKHGKYVIVYMDFSNFKYINEAYGYEVGDKVLKAYADGAKKFTGRFILGSRVFSDNLVCLLNADDWNDEQMIEAMESGSKLFTDRVQSQYLNSNIVCIIGLCPFMVDGNEVQLKNIISSANLARKEAKRAERGSCVIYDDSMGRSLQKEVEYANNMEKAFQNHEFVVYMQPKIDLKKRQIIGAEALIRWIKKDGTMIFPNEFIPVFEKNKSITLLDYFVYDEVCKYLAGRIERGEPVVNVSVNVSRIHLQSIDDMVAYIDSLLQRYKIPPQYLEFELTETISTERVEDTVEMLTKLRKLGVKVSMDDFGSGYSSLNVLTKLPLDVLKLDKEFLKDFDEDSDEKIIIPSIIDMAKKLKLDVVCEGVETKKQVEFLRDVDCDVAQGYFYSRPVPLDAFSGMLSDENFVVNQELKTEA